MERKSITKILSRAFGPVLFLSVVVVWTSQALAGMPEPCKRPPEAATLGEWRNTSPDDTEVVWLEVSQPFLCLDRAVEIDAAYYGPTWYVGVAGRCCDRNRMGATELDKEQYGEVETLYGREKFLPLFATFDDGDTRKYFFIYLPATNDETLILYLHSDYPNGGPPDKIMRMEFRKPGFMELENDPYYGIE